MDINKELNDIIIKNGLDEVYPSFKGYLRAQDLIDELIEYWKNKRVVCICNSIINKYYFENRVCDDDQIIDFLLIEFGNLNPDNKCDFIKQIEEFPWNNYDFVCIVGYNGSSIIGHQLRAKGIDYEFLYDYFELKGLFINCEWYDFLHHETGYVSYEDSVRLCGQRNPAILELFDLSQRIKFCRNGDELSQIIMKKIIFVMLFVHDFIGADKYLKQYISITQSENYLNAEKEISDLLERIRGILSRRARRDIVINWIDKVPYKDMKHAEYLSSAVKYNSIFFNHIYTMCPYTGPSFAQMFGHCKPVDDGGWDEWFAGGSEIENWDIIRDIRSSGYDFTSLDFDFKNFPKRFVAPETIDSYTCASDMLWKALSYVVKSDKPRIIHTHLGLETHEPFWSSLMTDEIINNSETLYHVGIKAVDQQLQFYNNIYNEEMIKIYLSDHGKEDFQSRFHCFLAIQSKDYSPQIVDDLCCWLDFGEILHALLHGKEIPYKDIKREYVELQEFNWINGVPQALAIKKKKPITWFVMGFRGALTKDYIYLKFNTGVEWFKRNDECATVLEPTWFQRDDDIDTDAENYLNQYRSWAGETKQEIADKYNKYNKYIQIIFNKAFKRNKRKIDEINMLFDSFGNKPVQLRMGGYHSYRFYSVLSSENRKRIKYVIDTNPKCMMSSFGIPVISTPKEEGVVVLSSWDHRDVLIKESDNYHGGVQVVDPYKYLSEKGFECHMPLYELEPSPEEYDVGFPLEEFARYE